MTKTAVSLAALILASGIAVAEDGSVFRYSANDLSTLDGIVATHDRIEIAARNFCGVHLQGTRDLGRVRQCLENVTDEIVSSIDDVRLTAYSRTGEVAEDLLAQR